MITYAEALEKNESKHGLDLGEISLDNLLALIEELPGWDYPLAEDLMHELAKRAGIDTAEYFTAADRDYSDLYVDATDKLGNGAEKQAIFWHHIGSREIFRDLASDYNTDNYSVNELEDFCKTWEDEDREDGENREYFLARVDA